MRECTKKMSCEDCILNKNENAWCKEENNPETDRGGNVIDGSDDFCSCGAHYSEECDGER